MFDIGWSELLIIGVVALIVIGPKDLPEMFRTLGRFTAKARSMSREFQRAMESAAKDSGAADAARDVKNATSTKNLGLDAVRDAAARFEKWDPLKPSTKPATSPGLTPDPGSPTPPAPLTGVMGPATASLAEARARERAENMASAENRARQTAPATAPVPIAAAEPSPVAEPVPKPKKKKAAGTPSADINGGGAEAAVAARPGKPRKSAAREAGEA